MYCYKCKTENPEEANFCRSCGADFRMLKDVATPEVQECKNKDFTENINGIPLEMVFVEEGSFMMGNNDSLKRERPAHNVSLSSFHIGKYPLTQAQWKAVMGYNPSKFTGDNLPVENVSWYDIQEFVQKLNILTGKRYRLPTEAEWEYAARGGSQSVGCWYSGNTMHFDVAWFAGYSGLKTHEVGQKHSNELGIYDMSGNVWEWCHDLYDSYDSVSEKNPRGPSVGKYRVLRGGSYNCNCVEVWSRYRNKPDRSYSDTGFRLVVS